MANLRKVIIEGREDKGPLPFSEIKLLDNFTVVSSEDDINKPEGKFTAKRDAELTDKGIYGVVAKRGNVKYELRTAFAEPLSFWERVREWFRPIPDLR